MLEKKETMTIGTLYRIIEEYCRVIEQCEDCKLYRSEPHWKCPYRKMQEQLIPIALELGVRIYD